MASASVVRFGGLFKSVGTLYSHHRNTHGESDPVVLEFDHQRDKVYAISWLVYNKRKIEVLQAEIEKCLVRCANCHRRKTAKDFGFYRVKAGAQMSVLKAL